MAKTVYISSWAVIIPPHPPNKPRNELMFIQRPNPSLSIEAYA
jgi:hypothetical protein